MRRAACLGMLMLFLAAPAPAREIAGVAVPETVDLPGAPLVLNGAGVRKKFFVKVYVGALYLPKPEGRGEAILDAPGSKSVRMHFLYEEVEARKLVDGWNEGFAANQTEAELQGLQPRLDRFNALFRTVRKGETIWLDYLPPEGTQVWIAGELKGSIPGADFNRALLKVWLGEKPADAGLKKAMLGER